MKSLLHWKPIASKAGQMVSFEEKKINWQFRIKRLLQNQQAYVAKIFRFRSIFYDLEHLMSNPINRSSSTGTGL